jgi:lipopolysaccharide biosynthesis glycosyltransferase
VTILSIGLNADDERRVRSSADPLDLRFVPVSNDLLPELRKNRHVSRATYGRLLGVDRLPSDVTRAVYLDSDLVVLDDLGPLFSMDLDGAAIGAAQSGAYPMFRIHSA